MKSVFLTRIFCSVVERSDVLFQKHLGAKDVFWFIGRELWRAFCKNVLTVRMFIRFADKRSGILFDEKGVSSSMVERSGVLLEKRLFDWRSEDGGRRLKNVFDADDFVGVKKFRTKMRRRAKMSPL